MAVSPATSFAFVALILVSVAFVLVTIYVALQTRKQQRLLEQCESEELEDIENEENETQNETQNKNENENKNKKLTEQRKAMLPTETLAEKEHRGEEETMLRDVPLTL